MDGLAVVLQQPQQIALRRLELDPMGPGDLQVEVDWSGISTGTEKLLWSGRMPPFPGMGYPLVPGYEAVGRVTAAGEGAAHRIGERVFVPGARCFGEVRGLFGGSASALVVPEERALHIPESMAERGVLLALAATAWHAIDDAPRLPELIIGHGVLGRLLARLTVIAGGEPVVWERNPMRAGGGSGYMVMPPELDTRRDYACIVDASGDPGMLDVLIARLAPRGDIVLAGFYDEPLSFAFPPAFMREARLRVAAQWQPQDLLHVRNLAATGRLSLDDLITHQCDAQSADEAYPVAFADPSCLKMILDWRKMS
ncbi:chlorophyll synthesis pathway protein BchC [Methyloversatilis thermotolerans]|uniref:chlorophyll synthesis pathway protein BchC n=1 Tax=Methyloversatilis thermotolerans TaxID=1346290 RepID=UPI00036587AD|nr:chlorophyll synthesis pathway protein BchC [Methyloversatilis thermotolerans]